jgi:hypothetical protein
MEKETKFNITKKMELLLCYKRTRVRETAQQIKLQKCGRPVNSGVVGVALNGMAFYPLNAVWQVN